MLALDPGVVDAVWQSFAAYLPEQEVCTHPLGCHRPRICDRDCFEAILFRLVTGCSWDVAGRLGKGSETTLRRRRDEWVVAGAYERLAEEAIGAFDKVIGLDLSDVTVDGSLHKAPCGGEGTGPNPTDRGKTGWKWSIATDANGVPLGWVSAGANRNDCVLLPGTLDAVGALGLLEEIETLHLDRGYDNGVVRRLCRARPRRPRPGPVPQPRHRRGAETTSARHALAGRADQLVAEQLRPAPTQHRPIQLPSSGSAGPGRCLHHHGQAHQMGQALERSSRRLMARALRTENEERRARQVECARSGVEWCEEALTRLNELDRTL